MESEVATNRGSATIGVTRQSEHPRRSREAQADYHCRSEAIESAMSTAERAGAVPVPPVLVTGWYSSTAVAVVSAAQR
jgi:hypothetical protein